MTGSHNNKMLNKFTLKCEAIIAKKVTTGKEITEELNQNFMTQLTE